MGKEILICIKKDQKPNNLGDSLGGNVVHRLKYLPDLGRIGLGKCVLAGIFQRILQIILGFFDFFDAKCILDYDFDIHLAR